MLQPGTETDDREVYKLASSIDKPKQGPLLTFPWSQDDGLAKDASRQFRKQTGNTFSTFFILLAKHNRVSSACREHPELLRNRHASGIKLVWLHPQLVSLLLLVELNLGGRRSCKDFQTCLFCAFPANTLLRKLLLYL